MTIPEGDGPTAPDESYGVPRRSSGDALEILDESLRRRLTGGELLLLCEEAALHDLGRTAHALRLERCDPGRVTYVVGRRVTDTGLSHGDCWFSASNRHGGAVAAHGSMLDEVMAEIRTAFAVGERPILPHVGQPPDPGIETREKMLRELKAACPRLWIQGFSPDAVRRLAERSGLQTLEVLRRLQEAGLDSMSGDDAGVLSDRVRRLLAPDGTTARAWIEISEEAHYLGLPTTAAMTIGHMETYPERVEHLLRLRESQDRTSGYTAFAPRIFRPAGTQRPPAPDSMARTAARGDPGVPDYLRTLAIARIALDNFADIQASWIAQGKSVGRLALSFGANDLGATMTEEGVVQADGVARSPTGADLEEMIRSAGFSPAQRDFGYNVRCLAPPVDDA
ncbi:dehypoxanthine futalosine cyclase [bacterium]|nr:dehypoxanthine futalosine cyclase [bacterium]